MRRRRYHPDFDCKHVLKRFRNALLRQKGIMIDGMAISTALQLLIITRHMRFASCSTRQTRCHTHESESLEADCPTSQSARHVLRLLRHLCGDRLKTYTSVALSFSDQVVHLSAARVPYHLQAIPAQTCFDTSADEPDSWSR